MCLGTCFWTLPCYPFYHQYYTVLVIVNFILTRSLVDLFPINSFSELPFSLFHINFTINFLAFVSKQCWFLEDCAECIGFSEERIYFITLNSPIYKLDKTLHFWSSSMPFNKHMIFPTKIVPVLLGLFLQNIVFVFVRIVRRILFSFRF